MPHDEYKTSSLYHVQRHRKIALHFPRRREKPRSHVADHLPSLVLPVRILGAGMSSCLRLDVGDDLEGACVTTRASMSSRRGDARGRHVALRRVGSGIRKSVDDQDTTSPPRPAGDDVARDDDARAREPASRHPSPLPRASVSRGRPTCTGDAQVLRGCPGHIPIEKLPICPKIRDSRTRLPGDRP